MKTWKVKSQVKQFISNILYLLFQAINNISIFYEWFEFLFHYLGDDETEMTPPEPRPSKFNQLVKNLTLEEKEVIADNMDSLVPAAMRFLSRRGKGKIFSY